MKRVLSVFVPVIVAVAFLCGCGEARVRRLATRMMKSEITVPQTLELMNGKYIADSSWLESDGKYRLIVTIAKEHCTSCRISAHELIDSLLVSVPSAVLAPMVVLSGPDGEALETAYSTIAKFSLGYPIYLDESSELLRQNPSIPEDTRFQSFLLDPDGRVVLIGDPTTDYNMMKLYRQVLVERTREESANK